MKSGLFLATALVISGAQAAQAAAVDLTGDLIKVDLVVSTGARAPRAFGTFTAPDVYQVDGFPYGFTVGKDSFTVTSYQDFSYSSDITHDAALYFVLTDLTKDMNVTDITLTNNGVSFPFNYKLSLISTNSVSLSVNQIYFPEGSSLTFNLLGTPIAAPEMATWVMLLTGFGATGMTLRRRARTQVRVAYA